MNGRERSLRVLAEKWLGEEGAKAARVTRFSHSARRRWRYVRVEAQQLDGEFSIVFFRHDDGSWWVFPPSSPRPVMGAPERPRESYASRSGAGVVAADTFA